MIRDAQVICVREGLKIEGEGEDFEEGEEEKEKKKEKGGNPKQNPRIGRQIRTCFSGKYR